jgi:hypothetical protein
MTGRPRNNARSFWSKVGQAGPDECWLWVGSTKNGYGRFCERYVEHYAHRKAFELSRNEPIPAGMVVMHSCNTKRCCNPAHLTLGTDAENSRASVRDGLSPTGERHPRAKYSSELIAAIRADPRPQLHLERVYGVSQTHISRIKARQSRKHDGDTA